MIIINLGAAKRPGFALMIGGRFLQFLDCDELCDAPPDTPLFASNLVQNEIEARLSIGFSVKGSIVSMPERNLSLVASKKTGFTIQLDFSTVAAPGKFVTGDPDN